MRRLGRVRCSFVEYPEGCKDFNEVLDAHGVGAVVDIISRAKPYPVSGVYRLSEFPAEPALQMLSTGWPVLDQHLMIYRPALMVVTGQAGIGKSAWTMALASNVASMHKWVVGVASFEMRVRPYVTQGLMASFLDKHRDEWTPDDIKRGEAWLEDKFVFIAPDPDDAATHDMDWLLEKASAAVIRHGMKMLVVDPWNEIEHNRDHRESSTDYVGRMLMKIKTFARKHDVLVVIVAHPTKSGADKGADSISLYDVSDSAHFANKADLGIVICRKGDAQFSNTTQVIVRKVRYQPDAGTPGTIELDYNMAYRRFEQRNPDAVRPSKYEPRQNKNPRPLPAEDLSVLDDLSPF